MKDYDVVIIGGGPAGLSCGMHCSRSGLKTIVLDDFGSQLCNISKIENFPGIERISGIDLLNKFSEQASSFGCEIEYDKAISVNSDDAYHYVTTENGETYRAKAITVATGTVHKKLGVSGEERLEGHGVSYCAVCDGPFFKDKKILVIGGGDSACQEAIYLTSFSKDVTICHRRETFRAQQSIVNKMLDCGVKTIMSAKVVEIVGDDKVNGVRIENADGNVETYPFDAVFVFVGLNPRDDIEFVGQNIKNLYETNEKMMTSIPGIFTIGDVRATPLRQITSACSDGAIAAHYIFKYIEEKT